MFHFFSLTPRLEIQLFLLSFWHTSGNSITVLNKSVMVFSEKAYQYNAQKNRFHIKTYLKVQLIFQSRANTQRRFTGGAYICSLYHIFQVQIKLKSPRWSVQQFILKFLKKRIDHSIVMRFLVRVFRIRSSHLGAIYRKLMNTAEHFKEWNIEAPIYISQLYLRFSLFYYFYYSPKRKFDQEIIYKRPCTLFYTTLKLIKSINWH